MSKKATEITLFRGWAEPGCYVGSPFVTKLEFRLRFAGVPYNVDAGSPFKAPKGKIPYVRICLDEETPELLGDSTLIIKRLLDLNQLEDINAAMPPEKGALDLALRALVEDRLYFYTMRERWFDNYYIQRDKALWSIPYPIRIMVGLLVYRRISQTLHGQGTSRYTAEEVLAFKREVWESINSLLESSSRKAKRGKPFWCLGTAAPTEADGTLFGYIVSMLVSMSVPESQKIVKSFPVILDYAERVHNQYFPDYEKWH